MLRPREWSLCLLLAACASEPQRSSLAEAQALAASLNRVGLAWTERIAAKDQNLCTAPAGLGLAVLATLPVADDVSDVALRQLFGVDRDAAGVATQARALLALLRDRGATHLELASEFWLRRGCELEVDGAAIAREAFGVQVREVDPANVQAALSRWQEQVLGKATAEPLAVDGSEALIVLQATKFDAAWAVPFDVARRRAAGPSGREGAWLDGTQRIRFVDGKDYSVVRVPFAGGTFALDLAKPDDGKSVGVAYAALRDDVIAARGREGNVELHLPVFELACDLDGTSILRDLRPAVRMRASTASATSLTVPLDRVRQQVRFACDKDGAHARAATEASYTLGEAGDFRGPFAFALRDLRTGLILFAGQVVDPTAK